MREVGRLAREYLEPCLTQLARARDERVETVCRTRFPELSYPLEQNREDIAHIPLGASETEIQEIVTNLHYGNLKEGREQMAAMVEEMYRSSTMGFHHSRRSLVTNLRNQSA
jgi:hypothetical protein